MDMVLLNVLGVAIARFKPCYRGPMRGGFLEFLPECWKTEQMWEEVIVSALVEVHYKQSQRIIALIVTV